MSDNRLMNTNIQLYNTLMRNKTTLCPIEPKRVRMYACGPTVYNYAHIGNARPIIVFDVLFRLLRHKYGIQNVIYTRNITDVDDKINAQAMQEGVPIDVVTERSIQQFHEDIAQLGVLEPTMEPRATQHIETMIEIIQHLIDGGFAYVVDSHVLFSPTAMNTAHDLHGIVPRYGALANRSLDEMRAGARIEIASYKRDAMDFVLWKPSSPELPGWDSPWGRGRPGWHIECSAMSWKYLGEMFDIHCGGIDLVFPHHENETAQSCCAFSIPRMASIWMHNGLLRVEGQKMSKSSGNWLTINQLLQIWPSQVLRLQILMTHYRQPLDWTNARCAEAMKILHRWHQIAADHANDPLEEVPCGVLEPLCDDLNTPAAIKELHRLASSENQSREHRQLIAAGRFLGVLTDQQSWQSEVFRARQIVDPMPVEVIEAQISERCEARRIADWSTADRIRIELLEKGVSLKDSKDKVTGRLLTVFEVVSVGKGYITIDPLTGDIEITWKMKWA